MRAPFDRTINLYWGPNTLTPGVLRVGDLVCRVVPDTVFIDIEQPLEHSRAYFTCDSNEPFGAATTLIGGGIVEFDFGKGDQVELTPLADITHYIQRVELRTRPDSPNYWRAYIAPINADPPTPCQTNYGGEYTIAPYGSAVIATLERISNTQWVKDGWTLTAETSPVDPDNCHSMWHLTGYGRDFEGYWNGQSSYLFFESSPPYEQYEVTAVP